MKKNSIITFYLGNIKIRVALNGFWKDSYKLDSPIHSHTNFECHVLLKGNACFETEEKNILLQQNDSVLVFPDIFHRFRDQDKDSIILSFSFSASASGIKTKQDYYSQLFADQKGQRDLIVFQQNHIISEYLKQILTKIYSQKLFAQEEIRALLLLTFAQIFSFIAPKGNDEEYLENEYTEYDARLSIIEEYFNEYYMESITLGELSRLLNLSEKQTDRIIKKAYGTGFKQRLSRVRLKNAQELLKNTDLEIRIVAQQSGYQSYNGFYLAFRKQYECTPQEYREQQVKCSL